MAAKSKAVVIREPQLLETRPYSQSFMDLLTLAVREGRSAAELRELYAIEQAIQTDRAKKQQEEDRKAWYRAMVGFQKESQAIVKAKMGGKAPYAPLENIEEVIKPIREKYGLFIMYTTEPRETMLYGWAIVAHEQGYEKELGHSQVPYLDPITGRTGGTAMNMTQAYAGTITYLKRYILAAALNLTFVGEDTDGSLGGVVTAEQLGDIRSLVPQTGYTLKQWFATAVDKPEDLTHKQAERLITGIRSHLQAQGAS